VRRFALAWMAPPLLLALLLLIPVMSGERAFFLRDVFSVHLQMRHTLAAASGDGLIEAEVAGTPLVDPYRGGSQALAYNPNTVAFYPTAWAHRVLPFFAAFNLHLWLHLLLAPLALYWLARELGLGRREAWAAGVVWGFSGFLVSQLAFYNLIAGVTLAPALAAAAVRVCRLRRRGEGGVAPAVVAVGLLWALLVVAGDPQTAVIALAGAAGLALAEPAGDGGRPRALGLLTAAIACGTLVALPQVTGLLAILPASARGAGYGEAMRGAGSLDPRQALGWLLPFADGRPDLVGASGFWGYRFHQGSWPFYFSLYPGLASFALVAAAGLPWRRRDRAGEGPGDTSGDTPGGASGHVSRGVLRRGWSLIAAGTFLALGAFNPLTAALLGLPGLDTLRYPLKFWLLAAMGAALVVGVGFRRAFVSPRRWPYRRTMIVLLAFATVFAVGWLTLRFVPATAGALHGLMPPTLPFEAALAERARWAGLALASAGAALALAAVAFLARRRPVVGGILLLTLHAALQLYFLAPAAVTEETAPYRDMPPILATMPADSRLAHGSLAGLFGGAQVETGELPVPEVRWVFRRTFLEGYPFAGALHGLRYDLNPSPEWLDSRELWLAVRAVETAPDDSKRLRLLAAWGIDRLLLHRPLELPPEGASQARLVAEEPSIRRTIRAYALPGAAADVHLATRLLPLPADAPPGAAAAVLADRRFRPGRDVVVAADAGATAPGDTAPGDTAPGDTASGDTDPARVRVLSRSTGRLEAETRSSVPGVLVWQRARLPLHRAWVDGEEVEPQTVNLYRVGVPVPAGEHRVRVAVDRRLLHVSTAGSATGLVALVGLALFVRRRPAPGTGAGTGPSSGAADDGDTG